MADLKINTDAAVSAARNIRDLNKQMRENFSMARNAVGKLDNSWESPAASAAMGKFDEIRRNYCDARYTVLDNYVNFLLQQVGEGYTQTEEVNVSLADQFK